MPDTERLGDTDLFPHARRQILAEERRRHLRHKAFVPAYASFNAQSANAQLDLNAVVDISEKGIAIQASPPLEVNQHLNLCLDLSETKAYVHVTGLVVWSDRTGRAGISFPQLPEPSSRQVREWLFLNLLHAGAKHFGEGEAPIPTVEAKVVTEPLPAGVPSEKADISPATNAPATPWAAVEAVRSEVKSLGADLEGALQLIAAKAQTFTRSAGAAVALSQGNETEMICRASAGTHVPPAGARLQVGSGFSGECVRTGLLLRCDDAETDLRVDRDSCRLLGIRSMLAAPVRLDDKVVGLLEVFSPLPFAFTENDSQVLRHLGEIVADAVHRASAHSIPQVPPREDAGQTPSESAQSLADDAEDDTDSLEAGSQQGEFSRRYYYALSIACVAVLVVASGFMIAPWVGSKIGNKRVPAASRKEAPAQSSPASVKPEPAKGVTPTNTLEELRALAEQGDPNAQFALGARYATGEQVKQDYAQAVTWFSKAADHGHVIAQATLGAYYWAGRGVPQDLSQAYFWSILARAGGDEASKYRATVLSSRMTRSQIAAAQQQADNWLRQHQVANSASPAH